MDYKVHLKLLLYISNTNSTYAAYYLLSWQYSIQRLKLTLLETSAFYYKYDKKTQKISIEKLLSVLASL